MQQQEQWITLRPSVEDELRNEGSEEVLDIANGEAEVAPVVAEFKNFQHVSLDINVAVEVHLVEGLHGDSLLAAICFTMFLLLEGQVVLDGLAAELGLLVFARRILGSNDPEGSEDG